MRRTAYINRRNVRRGFSLVELMVAVAVVAIVGSVVVVNLNSMRSRRSLHDAARNMVSQILKVRSSARAARTGTALATPGDRTARIDGSIQGYAETGVRIENATTISFFGDLDTNQANNNRQPLAVLDLRAEYPAARLRVLAPPVNTEIRFRRNATRVGGVGQITLENQDTGQRLSVNITLAGVPRIP